MEKLTKGLEDYIEAIYFIESKNGFSRVNEIGKFLKVKMPSVNAALKELAKKKLIVHKRYGYVKLTDRGLKLAKKIGFLHNELKEFFKFIGIKEKEAEKSACHLEHYIDEESVRKIRNFIAYLKTRADISDFRNKYE